MTILHEIAFGNVTELEMVHQQKGETATRIRDNVEMRSFLEGSGGTALVHAATTKRVYDRFAALREKAWQVNVRQASS